MDDVLNSVDKLGLKVFTNRVKQALPLMISHVKSAFVPNRLITYNFLIDFELSHSIYSKPKGKDDFMTLKLDVSKA